MAKVGIMALPFVARQPRRVLVQVLVLASAASAAWAIRPAGRVVRFEAREGLPAETIDALRVDRDGMLWIGTRSGLYRYDGYSFEAYRHDIEAADSISDNWIRTIYEDADRVLWAGTNTGGLNRMDKATESFEAFRHAATDPRSLSHDSVYAILQDGDGTLWVGTQSGLNRMERTGGTFRRVELLPSSDPRSGSEYVTSLALGNDGILWAGTNGQGLFAIHPPGSEAAGAGIEEIGAASLPSPDVFVLSVAPGGDLWIGTREGIAVRRSASGEIESVAHTEAAGIPIRETIVTSITTAAGGGVWAGTLSGLYRVAPTGTTVKGSEWIAEGVEGFDHMKLVATAYDRGGSLWIGTAGEGLQEIVASAGPFEQIPAGPGTRSGLLESDVTALLVDRHGRLWAGTFGSGLARRDPGMESFKAVPLAQVGGAVGLLRIAEDAEGKMWVASTQALERIDPGGGEGALFVHDPADPSSIPQGYVTCVLIDSAGRVWAGTGGGGLARLRPGGRSFDRFVNSPGDSSSPSDDYVTTLHEDREGRLWEGTRSGGLNLIDRDTGAATRVPVDASDPQALPHHYVSMTFEDRAGGLWVGTSGGGLARLVGWDEERGPRFERTTTRDGLADDTVQSIVEDDDGSLWIATRAGITRYDPRTRHFANYDAGDGLASSEGYLSSATRDDRRIYIGTTAGILVVPTGTPFPSEEPAPFAITSVRTLEGPAAGKGARWPPEKIDLRHGEVLTIEFAVTDFDTHRRHRYAMRRGGEDKSWVALGARRELTFTDLAPGDHLISLRGRGPRSGWSEPPATLRIRVVPPFYRTSAFEAAVAILIVAGAFTWHRVRTVRLERRNRELTELHHQREAALARARSNEEMLQSAYGRLQQLTRRMEAAKEEERRRIARELHDEMGQLLTAAKINIQLLHRHASEEVASRRLSDTVGLIDRMIQLVRALSFDLRPPLLEEMGLSAALRGYLSGMAERAGLSLTMDAEGMPEHLPPEMEIAAFRIVQEAVTNVIRHAGARRVEVTLAAENSVLRLVVKDDGCGFDPAGALAAAVSGKHLGLAGIHERAQALGGGATVDSSPGRGTTVSVELGLSRGGGVS